MRYCVSMWRCLWIDLFTRKQAHPLWSLQKQRHRTAGACVLSLHAIILVLLLTPSVRFKTGAFRSGFPIQPVTIRSVLVVCMPTSLPTKKTHSHERRFLWRSFSPTWETVPLIYHLWRFLTQFTHSVEVTCLPPYFPSTEETSDPTLYARNVQEVFPSPLYFFFFLLCSFMLFKCFLPNLEYN
jgi:hypothetical protein